MTLLTVTIPTLETDRLILRAPREEDFRAEFGFYDSEASRFVGGPLRPDQIWRQQATIMGHWMFRGYGYWAVDHKDTGDYLGRVGLWFPEGWPEREIGWTLLPAAQGNGYATEAALCLRAHGWDVTVLEKAPDLAEVGAGLQLSPNAMKVFEALGLDGTLAATGFTPDGIEIRMGESGMRLLHAPLGKTAVDRWGSPYLHIHRADLLDCLAQQLDSRAPGALRLGTAVTRYGQDGAGVTAVLETGETLSGDVLIGADGIHSAIRACMLGPDKPAFTGNVAWRAVVPEPNPGKGRTEAELYMAPGRHLVTYPLRGGAWRNIVAVEERDTWAPQRWSHVDEPDNLRAAFG